MELDVLIEGRLAGRLDVTDAARPVFVYDHDYTADLDATALSVRFPLVDQPAAGNVLGNWLEGLLPDDPVTLRSLCSRFNTRNPLRLLGSPIGVECAGAVQFCLPENTEGVLNGAGGLEELGDDALVDWLRILPRNATYRPYIASQRSSGFSLAGMQPKTALRYHNDKWHIAWGAEPTSHILKVARQHIYPHEAIIEHLTLTTANELGIPVASSRLLIADGVEAIVSQRYDRRRGDDGALRRIHQEDLCQALGFAPTQKYQEDGGPTPGSVAQLLRSADRSDPAMRNRFRDALIFSWLTVSTDAHAKNYSLLLNGRDLSAAPIYDFCSWLPYRDTQPVDRLTTAMKIGRKYSLRSADHPDAVRHTAKRLGLPPAQTAERFESLAARLTAAWVASVETLPDDIASLGIVERLTAELSQRADRCEQIAHTARERLLGGYRERQRRSGTAKRPSRTRTSSKRCGTIGKRSKKPCIRVAGHSGDHRYQ